MRLSDAIALGRTLAKPTSSYFLNDGCACARGMACLAIGKKEDVDVSIESLNNWPWLENEFAHPCHGKCEYTTTTRKKIERKKQK